MSKDKRSLNRKIAYQFKVNNHKGLCQLEPGQIFFEYFCKLRWPFVCQWLLSDIHA